MANWKNRTMWTGDNLDIMRGMNSESVDLIYLDPPFNSKHNYAAPIGSEAAGAEFKDTWTLNDIAVEWHGLIAEENPELYKVIDATMTKSDRAYIIYMAIRLLEMRRILKSTGSIYLHCDPTMSHYLKLVMDAIFGRKNFKSEIIWKRSSAHSDARQGRKQHGRIHDIILFYAKTDNWTWNLKYTSYDQDYIDNFYRHTEENTGRKFRLDNLTGPGGAAKGNPQYEVMGVTRYWRYTQEKMQQLIDAGRVVQTAPGRVPAYKRYLDEMPGVPLQDIWVDIKPIQAQAKERVGYPTQKPITLLDRIVQASSNPNDVMLDPFCGCATACIAAEKNVREWVGIDISPKAVDLVKSRMVKELGMFGQVIHRTDILKRTDIVDFPVYKTHKHTLYGLQEGRCNGCNLHFPFRNFTIDHIVPQARGGQDHIENLQLLCGACNSMKGTGTMAELLVKLKEHKMIAV